MTFYDLIYVHNSTEKYEDMKSSVLINQENVQCECVVVGA